MILNFEANVGKCGPYDKAIEGLVLSHKLHASYLQNAEANWLLLQRLPNFRALAMTIRMRRDLNLGLRGAKTSLSKILSTSPQAYLYPNGKFH